MLLSEKSVLIGQGQVNTSALHARQGLDRAHQLTLQPSLEIQALLKLGGAELLGFHQLKTHDRTLGQARRCQLQAHIVHLVRRHQNGGTTVGMLVRHLHLLQLRQDRTTVFV